MADSRYVTLTAGAVTTVTLDRNWEHVEIVNRDGSAEVFYTVGGTTPAPPANPTVEGNGTGFLPAAVGGTQHDTAYTTGEGLVIQGGSYSTGPTVVKLISAGTPRVYVRGW
jgi:hypothetical protein